MFKVPADYFSDFEELTYENEDAFDLLASEIVMGWLEKCLKVNEDSDHKWNVALMFPDIVPSMGRSRLHELANFFELAHHTSGRKGGKNRKMVFYPKNMFVEKQRSE